MFGDGTVCKAVLVARDAFEDTGRHKSGELLPWMPAVVASRTAIALRRRARVSTRAPSVVGMCESVGSYEHLSTVSHIGSARIASTRANQGDSEASEGPAEGSEAWGPTSPVPYANCTHRNSTITP